MIIKCLDQYTPEIATRIRELLIQLSRSGKDKGEIPEEWFRDLINSPFHDMLIAVDETSPEADSPAYPGGQIAGIATLNILMGPGIRKNAFLEDFVVDARYRGQGVGSAMWKEMLKWSVAHGCRALEFTCGHGREASQEFYKHHGAEIYDTNYFRKELG